MGTRTEEERLAECIQTMGPELGPIYFSIYDEVTWLIHKWSEYKVLYSEKKSRLELLNNSAPLFFIMIQNSLFEDILLSISRLTDRTTIAGKKNLTIQMIPELISDKKLAKEINNTINEIIIRSNEVRDHRNRRISHNDYLLKVDHNKVEPLSIISIDQIDDCLNSFKSLINMIEGDYFDSFVAFDAVNNPQGALTLLHFLDDGLEKRKERRKYQQTGDFTKAIKRKEI